MYKVLPALLLLLALAACEENTKIASINPENWSDRRAQLSDVDSLDSGATYLSSYSQIYTESEHRKFDLTGTISIRNINLRDTIFLRSAGYYDTQGSAVRNYFDFPIFVAPLETVEIIINNDDRVGGTGDNFYFEWSTPPGVHEPFFEGVFISTYGQQGLSFTTRGIRVE